MEAQIRSIISSEYPYMPNQRVKLKKEVYGEDITGIICGMATQFLAIPYIGTLWIVKLDQPLENYSYDCLAVMATYLEPLEDL